MNAMMAVRLSNESAAPQWGQHALLSFSGDEVQIHLSGKDTLLRQVQQAGRKLDSMGLTRLQLVGDDWDVELAFALMQGLYSAKRDAVLDYGILGEAAIAELETLVEPVQWVRETINASAETVNPVELCERAGNFIQQQAPEHVSFEIIQGTDLLEQGHVGIYNVGRGSAVPPALLKLDYNPTGDANAPVAVGLVGKGITFDSGGYSLKPSDMMAAMKSDMGGAATIAGALALAVSQGLSQRVQLYLCCAENMVSGEAYKLGDVLAYRNGKTVEVLNTDAEGRLVLADGLISACEAGAKHIIDAATLTGAAKIALGRDYNAVFGYSDELRNQALDAAREGHELAWPLPLERWHRAQIGSNVADMANIHSGECMAGATTAAAFLSEFVEGDGNNWLHFDLAGSFQKAGNALWAPGGKGHGVRTLAGLIQKLA